MKDATIQNALRMIGTASAKQSAGPGVDSSVVPTPLQADHPNGIEDGGHVGKLMVTIMSMTLVPAYGGDQTPDYRKPILTVDEAAKLLGMSRKRLEDIIYEEKTRLGRLPDFVCDAGGKIQRRILTDGLMEWVKSRRAKRGRPSKSQAQD